MNRLLDYVSSTANLPNKQFVQLLNGFETHQVFVQRASHELDLTVSTITNSLNAYDKRYGGLLLLKSFLVQCPLEIIEQKGNLWLSLCIKMCTQRKPSALVSLSYEIISDILVKSIHIPDLGKTIASTSLSKIIETVNGLTPECHLAALKCLEICMKHYAGPSGSSRAIIDRFLYNFIDCPNRSLVLQSGKCLHLLQQVRGGGTQGVSQKGAWSALQSQLLGSLHKTLDQIYANTMEIMSRGSEEMITLKTAELNLSADPFVRATQLTTRFQNLCEYLRVTLCEPFPVPKAVQPNLIFALISRGLAVDCMSLTRNSITDNIAMGALLPQIHIALYRLLNSLILLMRSNLLPQSNDICQLVLQTLRWTSSGKASGFQRPYSDLRQAAYNTLSLWCKTTQGGSLVEVFAEELFKYIIQDASPYQSEVTLKVLAGSRKYLSKKARQKLHKAQNDASNITQTHSKAFNPHNTKIIYTDNGNEMLCVAALNCLTQILYASGCFVKSIHQKILQEKIVAIALNVVNTTPKESHLYSDGKCRAALYEALCALVQSPHHLCPPPVQYAVEIFRIAQINDQNAWIRDKCADYLRVIEKILHPQKEVFFFTTDPNEVREIFKKTGDNARAAITGESDSDDNETADLQIDFTNITQRNGEEEKRAQPSCGSQTNQIDLNNHRKSVERKEIIIAEDIEETMELSPPNKSQMKALDTHSQSSQSPITISKESSQGNDIEHLSPPRKSARLTAKRERTDSTSSRTSLTRCESPLTPYTPRRRSTRISSLTVQESTPSRTDEIVSTQLSTIAENSPKATNSTVDCNGGIEKKTEDEMVDQLFADFVDESADEQCIDSD